MYVHSMKELHNKYVIMTNYHYFNLIIIIKTETRSTIKTMESQCGKISGAEQQI